MIHRLATNRTPIATVEEVQARVQATAAPVFADVSRFSDPSPTRMVWMPSTTGQHPSFV